MFDVILFPGFHLVYNILTLRRDLESIGFSRTHDSFIWEQEGQQGIVNSSISSQFFNHTRRKNNLNDLVEYCWHAYMKANTASGAMLIGRTGDLWRKDILQKCNLAQGDNLWKQEAKGNILAMDKWLGVLNDCWIMGGIHRYADFRLMSPLSPDNLWNYQSGFHVVTAREILGLLRFGYKKSVINNIATFKCGSLDTARRANLRDYELLMRKEQLRGISSITKLISANYQHEILSFNQGTMRNIR
ncbi:hypothetical protein [Buttiauxella sp.]|uniref:hypothetical protein n=1 Tax=Buttiauxella sp. TaxID=1972222 RepID=UPI003C778587